METIYALASARGKAGVAVIRVSGPNAFAAAQSLAGGDLPRRGMRYRKLVDGDGTTIDSGVVLTFQAPASFTGEDTVEFQVHGSVAIVSALLDRLGRIEGLSPAEPGAFTRRALENGRLDLSQVEGLADLIDAETEAQRRQAQTVLSGELGRRVDRWRGELVRAASLIEAVIDFADEEVPEDVSKDVCALISAILGDLRAELRGAAVAERIRTGFEVAIVGRPNVGKSTLLNALAGRDAAITSEFAGTTRDVIEVRMDLNGLPVTVLDTAGIRSTDDQVENIGIARARSRAIGADLRVFLLDGPDMPDIPVIGGDIQVLAKADRFPERPDGVSGLTGKGVSDLVSAISAELGRRSTGAGIATRERHVVAMRKAMAALEDAEKNLAIGPDRYDITAEELRTAIRALESLVGRIDVEDLLDEIFASFCLGK